MCAPVLAGFPESGVSCFVTAFSQRYACLCQLRLERAYNYVYVSVYVTIDIVCWLYCV